jgi:hypothetical protein
MVYNQIEIKCVFVLSFHKFIVLPLENFFEQGNWVIDDYYCILAINLFVLF